MDERPQSLRVNLLLSLVTVVVVAAALEGAARGLIYWRYGNQQHGMWWNLYYEPYLLFKWDERMHEPTPPKSESYRILVVGGSTAALMPDATLAEAFEATTGRDVEVINIAQGGYITTQEQVGLTLYGLPLEPDLVLTLDGYNDIVNASKTGDPFLHYWNGFIENAMENAFLNALYSVLRHSQFINAISKLSERNTEAVRYENEGLQDALLAHYATSIRSMAQIARGANATYIATLQPYAHLDKTGPEFAAELGYREGERRAFVTASLKAMHDRITALQADEGFLYVNALPVFDEIEDGTSVYEDEVHLTDEGNRILAEYIVRSVAAQGFRIEP